MNTPAKARLCSSLLLAILTASIWLSTPALADEKKEAKQAARRIAQIKQQLVAEQTQMQTQFQAEKAALEAKASENQQQATALKADLSTAQRNKMALSAELERLRKELAQMTALQQKTSSAQQQAEASLANTKASLAELEAMQHQDTLQRKELSSKLMARAEALTSCENKNGKLHAVTLDLIQSCQQPGTFDKLLRTEPLTQIKRVTLENTLETLRDKADAQHITNIGQ